MGFGSPIVEGRTPYTLRQITVPGASGRHWPPDADAERLAKYRDYEALIEARPEDVFSRLALRPDQQERILLALALPELVCNVWADALYGENSPDVTFPDGGDEIREAWDRIWAASGGDDVLGWEAVFGTAFSGTGVDHVYRDEDGEVHVESITPGIYFPSLRPGSSRDVETVTLAWAEDREGAGGKSKPWQVTKHYALEGGQLVMTHHERPGGETAWKQVAELRPDGMDFLPFVDTHAKRWRGRFWGVSELSRSMTVFAEIDSTLSRVGQVLEYHGEPMLQVPSSVLFGGVLAKGSDRVIGIRNPDDTYIARYITYDGMVDAQIKHLDGLIDKVLLVSEVQRTYYGLGDNGAASGTALRLNLQGLLKKIGRWQRKEESRLIRLADMTLRLSGITDPVQRRAIVTAGNPLPVDDEQEVRILVAMRDAGLISRETAMAQTRRFDDVGEELVRLNAEEQTGPTSGFGLPAALPVVPPAGLGAVGIAEGIPPEQRGGDVG